MSLVLDASATLAWIFPDETTPEVRSVFDQINLGGCFVPQLWRLELAHRLALPLATLDRGLRAGATALGLPLLGL